MADFQTSTEAVLAASLPLLDFRSPFLPTFR
jgi:hypothetical protein